MGILRLVLAFLRVLFGSRAALAAENLALRQQLIVLQRSVKRPKLRGSDRIFWSWLSRLWSCWRSALLIVQPATVVRQPKPSSQNWRTFLKNHVGQIAAIDFFTVATITFRVLCVFLVLRHDRRRVVHFNVTTNPTAQWAARQVVEAFPFEEAPRFLLRDRDAIYGERFRDRVEHMGMDEALISPRAPWQNPCAERVIGSIRRECLDHVIVLNEDNPRRTLAEYFAYYHEARAHLSLERNSPDPRQRTNLALSLESCYLWPPAGVRVSCHQASKPFLNLRQANAALASGADEVFGMDSRCPGFALDACHCACDSDYEAFGGRQGST